METARRTIREWRAYLKMNKNDVSKKLGVHPSTYAGWEEKPENIKMGDTIRIAQIFNCTVYEIDFYENIPVFKTGFEKVAL